MRMVRRRSPDRIAAEEGWRRFVEHNAEVVDRAGLPPRAVATVADWDDFLVLGHLAGDTGGFNIAQLNTEQYAVLLQLVVSYFAAGYEFYLPLALHADDQDAMRTRFGLGA